jgi:aspartate/methionine/tyrosine aminotransferase
MALRPEPSLDNDLIPFEVATAPRVGSRITEQFIEARVAAGGQVFSLKGGPVKPFPLHIREAVLEALDAKDLRPSRGLLDLRTAITSLLFKECQVSIDPESNILITNGAMHGLSVVFRTLLEPGDQVVIPAPAFFFDGLVRLARAEPIYVPSTEGDNWKWDIERLAHAIGPKTKIIIACNPNNPTGYLPTSQDLQELVDLAQEHNLVIVADESYNRMIYEGHPFSSFGSFLPQENIVLVRSMSKSYAMPNWRIGFVAASEALLNACLKIFEWDCLHCNYVGQKVASAAIQGPQDWLDGVSREYELQRDIVYSAIQRTEFLSCVSPKAGPFHFVNTSRLNPNSGEVAEALLNQAGIPTVPGEFFQAPGYLRLPFGGDVKVIQQMSEALVQWDAEKARGF